MVCLPLHKSILDLGAWISPRSRSQRLPLTALPSVLSILKFFFIEIKIFGGK